MVDDFDRLLQKEMPVLERFVRFRIGNAHDADDVLQETCIAADDSEIAGFIKENVDMRPGAIIEKFDLRRPIYAPLSAYGHMGREDLGVSLEKTDRVDLIKERF